MHNLRLWILVLCAVSFACGTALGVILAREQAQEATGDFKQFESMLTSEFELSPERQRLLRGLLRNYQSGIKAIEDKHRAEYRTRVESELQALGRDYNGMIRDSLLASPANQAEFDQLILAAPLRLRTP